MPEYPSAQGAQDADSVIILFNIRVSSGNFFAIHHAPIIARQGKKMPKKYFQILQFSSAFKWILSSQHLFFFNFILVFITYM